MLIQAGIQAANSQSRVGGVPVPHSAAIPALFQELGEAGPCRVPSWARMGRSLSSPRGAAGHGCHTLFTLRGLFL